jgi:hypothetical protein
VKFEVFGVVCAGVADSEVALSDEHVGLITVKKKNLSHYSLNLYEFWRKAGCVLLAPVLMLVPSIIQVMLLKMMRRVGHVTSLWWITLKERDILEELRAEMRIILKCILKKQDGKTWTGLMSQIRTRGGFF